jgi:predicted  nucleic acid-binding Zn-ribbon protein
MLAGVLAACDSGAPSPNKMIDQAESARAQSEAAALEVQQAIKALSDANGSVEAALLDLSALDDKISKAVDAVASAQTDAEGTRTTLELRQLRKEKVDLEAKLAAAKAAAARAERAKGVHISKECLDNPLAKGCS